MSDDPNRSFAKALVIFVAFAMVSRSHAQSYGLVCYNCQRISRVIDCHSVTRCSDGEECYIEKEFRSQTSTATVWNLGCKREQMSLSASSNSLVTCSKYCNGTLCNMAGCDIPEFGSPRSPVCYTCSAEETPQSCNQVKLCNRDEVCQLSRIGHGQNIKNISFYGSCVLKQACPQNSFTTNSMIVGKRQGHYRGLNSSSEQRRWSSSTTLCMACCSSDVCNDQECPYTPQTTTVMAAATTNKPTGWSPWLAWSECTVSCGDGSRFRVRTCMDKDPVTKQTVCIGGNVDVDSCNTTACVNALPVNGGWGNWGPWSQCAFSCGKSSVQHRFRQCDSPAPVNGGSVCPGSSGDSKVCYYGPCCFGSPPNIAAISPNTNVSIGDTVILHCNATGYYENIIWEGPKVVGHVFPANVEVFENGHTLVITTIRQENVGLYRCSVRGGCGSTSRDILITSL